MQGLAVHVADDSSSIHLSLYLSLCQLGWDVTAQTQEGAELRLNVLPGHQLDSGEFILINLFSFPENDSVKYCSQKIKKKTNTPKYNHVTSSIFLTCSAGFPSY